jgi:hypothetical protein
MNKPGMAAHSCNPSYAGGRARRIMVQGQPWATCESLTKEKGARSIIKVIEGLPS